MNNVHDRFYSSDFGKNQSNICSLPRDVLGRIMTFLVLREITQFDTAVINKDYRVSFLETIGDQRVYLGEVKANFDSTIGYILRRGLFLLDLGNLRDPHCNLAEVPLTPLLWAIDNIPEVLFKGGDDMKLLDMLTSGDVENVDIDSKDNDGCTALMIASENGHVGAMELLISKGSDINTKADHGCGLTALMLASENGHINAIELLISKGSDINIMSNCGLTALMFASKNGHVNAMELLIFKGSDVHSKDNGGRTALMFASKNGHVDDIELLISKGYDVHAKDDEGSTALMYAIQNGHVDAMKLLISKGATT